MKTGPKENPRKFANLPRSEGEARAIMALERIASAFELMASAMQGYTRVQETAITRIEAVLSQATASRRFF